MSLGYAALSRFEYARGASPAHGLGVHATIEYALNRTIQRGPGCRFLTLCMIEDLLKLGGCFVAPLCGEIRLAGGAILHLTLV
jgi:hypothetical protein